MRFVSKERYIDLQRRHVQTEVELKALKEEIEVWRKSVDAHLETVYVLWDNALIEHEETCAAHPEDEGEDIDNDSCDCGAVAVVNGDHFKAAKKLTADRVGS